jgi:glycine C-acetyltransferase
MRDRYITYLRGTVEQLRANGFYKPERVIASRQSADVRLADGSSVLNLCANNYLGLADDARLIAAAKQGLDRNGFGMASVRFICGTQTVHKELDLALAAFLQTDDCILYSSAFDANGGLFETLFDESDAIISDELNHASIIDGVRLSKAKRYRYKNNDLGDLEARLNEADAASARFKLIATDGVFSMDGSIANLAGICDLADRYGALVMVDDSHAVVLSASMAAVPLSIAACSPASTSLPARWARRWVVHRAAMSQRAGR